MWWNFTGIFHYYQAVYDDIYLKRLIMPANIFLDSFLTRFLGGIPASRKSFAFWREFDFNVRLRATRPRLEKWESASLSILKVRPGSPFCRPTVLAIEEKFIRSSFFLKKIDYYHLRLVEKKVYVQKPFSLFTINFPLWPLRFRTNFERISKIRLISFIFRVIFSVLLLLI